MTALLARLAAQGPTQPSLVPLGLTATPLPHLRPLQLPMGVTPLPPPLALPLSRGWGLPERGLAPAMCLLGPAAMAGRAPRELQKLPIAVATPLQVPLQAPLAAPLGPAKDPLSHQATPLSALLAAPLGPAMDPLALQAVPLAVPLAVLQTR